VTVRPDVACTPEDRRFAGARATIGRGCSGIREVGVSVGAHETCSDTVQQIR